jgi:hypothetical protein
MSDGPAPFDDVTARREAVGHLCPEELERYQAEVAAGREASPSGRDYGMAGRFRNAMKDAEQAVMAETVDALLKAGYILSVFDGRYETVTRTTVRDVILAGMRTTEQDYLLAYRGEAQEAKGWVRLSYVNPGEPTVTRSPGLS